MEITGVSGSLLDGNQQLLIDLCVGRRGKLSEVYEVKSSTSRQDVYTAIGQLTVHAVGPACRRIMVLPAGQHLKVDLERALTRNGIELILYKLSAKAAIIL